jgi:hypothetical protein
MADESHSVWTRASLKYIILFNFTQIFCIFPTDIWITGNSGIFIVKYVGSGSLWPHPVAWNLWKLLLIRKFV